MVGYVRVADRSTATCEGKKRRPRSRVAQKLCGSTTFACPRDPRSILLRIMMPSHISTDALTEADPIRRDDQGNVNGYTDLDAACLRISESLETETVLQSVIDNARWLTNARYGVLLAFTGSGEVENIFSSGTTAGGIRRRSNPAAREGTAGILERSPGTLAGGRHCKPS